MNKSRSTFTVGLILFLTGGNILLSQSWIRINQLGYTPDSRKVAVFVSKEHLNIEGFNLRNAFVPACPSSLVPTLAFHLL